jgi:hypothetical protein
VGGTRLESDRHISVFADTETVRGAPSGALPADLARIVERWPILTPATRAAITGLAGIRDKGGRRRA